MKTTPIRGEFTLGHLYSRQEELKLTYEVCGQGQDGDKE